MSDNFGLKIGFEGEKEFKKSLSEINNSFKVLGSEMKLKSDDGCNGCTGDVPAEHKNHDGVKNDIQEISQKLPHHRLAGLPLGADDVGVAAGD